MKRCLVVTQQSRCYQTTVLFSLFEIPELFQRGKNTRTQKTHLLLEYDVKITLPTRFDPYLETKIQKPSACTYRRLRRQLSYRNNVMSSLSNRYTAAQICTALSVTVVIYSKTIAKSVTLATVRIKYIIRSRCFYIYAQSRAPLRVNGLSHYFCTTFIEKRPSELLHFVNAFGRETIR